MPAGKIKGKGATQKIATSDVETSNKFEGLENEEPAEQDTGTPAVPA